MGRNQYDFVRLLQRIAAQTLLASVLAFLLIALHAPTSNLARTQDRHAANPPIGAPWSRNPPPGLKPGGVPQFVSVTFDDNFGLALPGSVGGLRAIIKYYAASHNPMGTGEPANFDGGPIRTTFFDTGIYIVDSGKMVLGGHRGEDHNDHNRSAWKAAVRAGHEIADHTVNHLNGGSAIISKEECCRAGNWSVTHWMAEIASCRSMLMGHRSGIGAKQVIGFRAPFLSYNDHVFTALQRLSFTYDSSVPNCFAEEEDGTNCSWPYSLDHGSPDADAFSRELKLSNMQHPILFPQILDHRGLWELPITTLIIPPDAVASEYHFKAGLRDRVESRGALRYPSFYEPLSGKITGLDYALLIDAGVTGDEMRAILEYNLDLHLSGNRSPLVFIAHAHLYAFSTPKDNPDTPSDADRKARWKGLTAFIAYALTKPEVRIVADRDILAWMQTASSPRW